MNQELLQQVISILVPALATLMAGWFTVLGTKLKKVYEEKAKSEVAKSVVKDTVSFVQQVYKDLEGPEKLKKAIEQAQEILASKGIVISEAEINMLIESSVYGIKQGLLSSSCETLEPAKDENEK